MWLFIHLHPVPAGHLNIPPRSLTLRPWKVTSFPIGKADRLPVPSIFQGFPLAVKLRGCIDDWPPKKKWKLKTEWKNYRKEILDNLPMKVDDKIHHFDGIYQEKWDFHGRTVSFREGISFVTFGKPLNVNHLKKLPDHLKGLHEIEISRTKKHKRVLKYTWIMWVSWVLPKHISIIAVRPVISEYQSYHWKSASSQLERCQFQMDCSRSIGFPS